MTNLKESNSVFTELNPEDDYDKIMIKVKERNALVVASFTMAFTTQGLTMLVNKSCTDEWPGGLAYKIVEELLK